MATHDTHSSTSAAALVPQRCPQCASTDIRTTAKVPSVSAYWRCMGCGEIWAPSRRLAHVVERWRR